jgi:hypothetical protein
MTLNEITTEIARLQAMLAELEKPEPSTEPIRTSVVLTPGSSWEASQLYHDMATGQTRETLPEGSQVTITASWIPAGSNMRLHIEGNDSKVQNLERQGATLAASASKSLAPMARSTAAQMGPLGMPLGLTQDREEPVPLVISMPPRELRVWLGE